MDLRHDDADFLRMLADEIEASAEGADPDDEKTAFVREWLRDLADRIDLAIPEPVE